MSTYTGALKASMSSHTKTAKDDDLRRDTVDPSRGGPNYLTTDPGVKVEDTDNWSASTSSK